MHNHIKRFFVMIGFTALMVGLLGFQPANAAEVSVSSSATSTSSAQIDSTTRQTINGLPVVSWINPEKYKSVKLTKRAVQKAPVVRVNMSFSSAKLFKKSRGAKYVRVIGTWRNTGKYGNIKAGFPTTAKQPGMLMVYNSKTRIYEHGYTLKYPNKVTKTGKNKDIVKFYTKVKVGKKWVKVAVVVSCFNDFFGKVQKIFRKVVQIVYEGDAEEEAAVSARADAEAKAKATATCPDGTTVSAEAAASSSAVATGKIRYFIKYRVSAINAKKIELINKVKADAEASAKAAAEAKISIKCGETPPPVKPKAVIEIDELNDVDLTDPNCDGDRDACESYLVSTAHATVPSGASGTLRISSNIGTVGFANGTPANWRDDVKTLNIGSGQHDVKYRFNAPTEGNQAVITLTYTPSAGSGVAPEPVKTTVKLNAPPTPPM